MLPPARQGALSERRYSFMDQSEAETAKPLSRVALPIIGAAAGSVTLAWFTFLVWLFLKALSLL